MKDLLTIFERFGIYREYPRGTVLLKEGAPATFALLITSGVVQVSRIQEEKQFVIALRGPGDVIGEMVFDGQPRSATVTALSDTTAVYLATETFRKIVYEEPEVTMQLFQLLLQRLRQATEQVGDMALISVYERLRKLLLSRLMQPGDTGATDLPANFQSIGNHVGASRDMISKIFKELVRGDYVNLEEGTIHLLRRLPPKM